MRASHYPCSGTRTVSRKSDALNIEAAWKALRFRQVPGLGCFRKEGRSRQAQAQGTRPPFKWPAGTNLCKRQVARKAIKEQRIHTTARRIPHLEPLFYRPRAHNKLKLPSRLEEHSCGAFCGWFGRSVLKACPKMNGRWAW